ncbi:MAG: VOC family protein [Acidobacteriota bacterium]
MNTNSRNSSGSEEAPNTQSRHLGHVHLEVRDLQRSIDYYRDFVGLQVIEAVGRFAFLSFGEHHHDIALQQVRRTRGSESGTRPGLYHVAFEVPSEGELTAAGRWLREHGTPFDLVDHGVSRALYTQDPDGHGIELYVDRRALESGRERWGGATERLAG